MAPTKFGLFKSRSRDQEQPSTENLLQNSNSTEYVGLPSSPVATTSKGQESPGDRQSHEDDEVISEMPTPTRRASECIRMTDSQVHYHPLKNQQSVDATSTSTLDDFDQPFEEHSMRVLDDQDGASTSCDANSIQFDETSIAPSEDLSVYCGTVKKPKKMKSKEEQQMRDFDMWQATNVEVMQNLLSRSGTLDEQIKWEAIATARGLCTLTDSCTCGDCTRAKYLAGVTDGDGGLGAAPLFNAISVGCSVQ